MKDFELAYDGWLEINVKQDWEIARAISFYILKPHDSKDVLKKWDDTFALSTDKKKKKPNIFIRKMNKDEEKEFEQITGLKANV